MDTSNAPEKVNEWVEQSITRLPLYKKITLDDEQSQRMALAIQEFAGRFDQYCPSCAQPATFAFQVEAEFSVQQRRLAAAASIPSPGGAARGGNGRTIYRNFTKVATCTRKGHRVIYHYQVFDDGVMKIGQFPSIADIFSGDIQPYRKVLGEDDMKGLKTAIGLHAHGVGAGAFIYLRKIFEGQVEQAHQAALRDADWDESAYVSMKMGQRIQALKLHLPEVLVRNSTLYSILSEHLHEGLSENDCLANFDVVLQGILVIADERLAELQRSSRLANFAKSKQTLLEGRAEQASRKDGPA